MQVSIESRIDKGSAVEPKKSYKLGMGQLLVEGGQQTENIARAVRMIGRAADAGCSIVVMPECSDLGWTSPTAKELATPIPGPITEQLGNAAREAGIYAIIGLTERDGDKMYNTAVMIDDAGEVIAKHRKINVLGIAQDLYSTGDRLTVTETPLGTIGMNICADNFPNSLVLAHSLARMGAQLILSPSAWAVTADHSNETDPYGGMWRQSYVEISKLYDIYLVGVSNVGPVTGGPWDGHKCIGCSMAYGPGGVPIGDAPYGDEAEELVVVDVTPTDRTVRGTAWPGHLEKLGYKGI